MAVLFFITFDLTDERPGPTLALVCLHYHVVDHPPPRRQQRRERHDPLGLLAQPGAGHGRVSQNIFKDSQKYG